MDPSPGIFGFRVLCADRPFMLSYQMRDGQVLHSRVQFLKLMSYPKTWLRTLGGLQRSVRAILLKNPGWGRPSPLKKHKKKKKKTKKKQGFKLEIPKITQF